MELGLPKDCVSLYAGSQKNGAPVNIIGIITDALPPSSTSGTDWQLTFSLEDEASGSKFQVKLFHSQHDLPPISGTGDVIHLKGIPWKGYRNNFMYISSKTARWTLFLHKDIPTEHPNGSLSLPFKVDTLSKANNVVASQDEMAYAITLCESRDRAMFRTFNAYNAEAPTLTSGAGVTKQKFDLVENIQERRFYDLVGQVVDTFDLEDRLIIYFTDYTNNKLLFNYQPSGSKVVVGDELGYLPTRDSEWKGPMGQFTFMVTIWDENRAWCLRNVKRGDYVELSNVRVKFGKEDISRLEGAIHGSKYGSAVRIRIQKLAWDKEHPDERLKNLLQLRREFVKNNGDWLDEGVKKRKADESSKQSTKNGRKRQRQKETKKGQSEEAQTKDKVMARLDESGLPPLRKQLRKAQDVLNAQIVCSRDNHPVTHISSILSQNEDDTFKTSRENEGVLPWQNRRRRADLRVVDFFPPDVRSFAVRERVSEYDGIDDEDEEGPQATLRPESANEDDSDVSDNSEDESVAENQEDDRDSVLPEATQAAENNMRRGYRYVWRFALLVEDRKSTRTSEPARMVINVGGDAAIFLLDIAANDLYKKKNRALLGKLREKLFILWGDLEEKKQEAAELRNEAQGPDGVVAQNGSSIMKPNNVPFSCCIEEYAIRLPGPLPRYERRFALFDTRIK